MSARAPASGLLHRFCSHRVCDMLASPSSAITFHTWTHNSIGLGEQPASLM